MGTDHVKLRTQTAEKQLLMKLWWNALLKIIFFFRKYCLSNTACRSLPWCAPDVRRCFIYGWPENLLVRIPSCPAQAGHLDPCPNAFCCNLAIIHSEFFVVSSWLISSAIWYLIYKTWCLFTSECLKLFLMLGWKTPAIYVQKRHKLLYHL